MGAIYKIYGIDGECLYVGMTTRENPGHRFTEHCREQPWRHEIRGMDLLETNLHDEQLRDAERRHATLWGPKYGNWSSPATAPEPARPVRRGHFRLCPAAVKLIVLRSGRTMNEAALLGCMPFDVAGRLNRGVAVFVDRGQVAGIAARLGVTIESLTCTAGAA